MAKTPDPARRVVVTGMGCVTPLGLDVARTWEAAIAGESGVRTITHFDPSDYPVRFAGQLPGETPADLELGAMSTKDIRRTDRGILYAVAASIQAVAQAGLDLAGDAVDPLRVGTAIGSGIGGLGTLLENHHTLLAKGPRRVSAFTIPMAIANMPSGVVSIHHGLRGPNFCHVSACATGAHSIGESARLIARGEADAMVAGGTEAPIFDLAVAGFAAMRALSARNDEPERASRPFDVDRDGFVMGEGAGVMVLESLEHARRRGATPLAEVSGYAATADATHLAAPQEEGEGIVRCMRLALEDAELAPEAIDHVNAHATSTPAGDPIEARALRTVFGGHVDRLPVSATKSMTGHLLGAAGAVEAILCVRALQSSCLPPTINLDRVDADCELDHVLAKARPAAVRHVLSNSFGFGGTNACLVLSAWEGA
ncbi:MAG: beta-ketoacyl-ACP synthase II [Myxococcota bacterium]